uniref:interleukin-18 receptor accessory protein-like isoform X2 n=1 Tax=Scatophagus argus TaxID=75038 RepID=UPI001ED83484|nr:interleukin-18 receptor accessory protein-like isoform X2 [Scatophagus argus]
MQTGYVMFLSIFPIFLEGCCMENHQKKIPAPRQDVTEQRYRVVEGETLRITCPECVNPVTKMVGYRTGEGTEGNKYPYFRCGMNLIAEAKHSGKYIFPTCSNLTFHLQVIQKKSLRHTDAEKSSKYLLVGEGGKIPCPGLSSNDNTNVTWYKGDKLVSQQRRASCEVNGTLNICKVRESDTAEYFCDRQIMEQGVKWIFRRTVNVTVIPFVTPSSSPRIIYPLDNMTEEVVLGQSHTLECKVYFPFEIHFSPEVGWYMDFGGNMQNMSTLQQQEKITLQEFKVTQMATIKEVTQQHLDSTYTCLARNTVGTRTVTVKLKEKNKVKLVSPVEYRIASFLLVAGLGIVLHVKWLELRLIYRSHFQHGKHRGEEKEFDAFVSYVWSPASAEVGGVLKLSSQSRQTETDEEVCLSCTDPLNSEEDKDNQGSIEVLLPQMLEDHWGYRLCLLERDVLPGGAYADDVVLAIQRSQMLICLLSAEYLTNNNAVFVLESGVQALLQNSISKLLLIWTDGTSASHIKPDPLLSTLVHRALKVLPSLVWTSGQPARATNSFWWSLRKAMPNDRVKLVSLT